MRGECEQDRVAVGGRLCALGAADIAGSTRNVLDIKLPAEILTQLLRQDARKRIGDSAGCKRHHGTDWPVWIGLRARQARGEGTERCARSEDELPTLHVCLPC